MIEEYLINLVNQIIPMPNEWLESIGVSVNRVKRSEFDEISSQELSGYSLGDDLSRGYIKHTPRLKTYTEDTHYLLGMYLRALRDLKNINLMPFYNCVLKEETVGALKYSYVAILKNVNYSIYIDTQLPIRVKVRYSNLQESQGGLLLDWTLLSTKTSGGKYSFRYTGNVLPELQEYLELIIESPNFQSVSVLEGDQYCDMLMPPIFNGKLTAKIKYAEGKAEVSQEAKEGKAEVSQEANLYPTLMKERGRWSNKLIQCLLDVSVTEESPRKIKQVFLSKFQGSSVSNSAKINTEGVYDINEQTDKRLKV